MSGQMPQAGEGQARPVVNFAQFVRPEQIKNLPHFDDVQKVKYEEALRKMWQMLEQAKSDPTSPEFSKAVQSLSQASSRIRQHIKNMNQQQAQGMQRPGSQQGQAGPAVAQPQPAQNAQQPQQQPMNQGQRPPQGPAGPMQLQQFQPFVMQRINGIEWATPAGTTAGTPEAEAKLNQIKNQFGQAVVKEAALRDQIQKMQPVLQGFTQRNAEIPPEMQKRYLQTRQAHQQTQEMQKRIVSEHAQSGNQQLPGSQPGAAGQQATQGQQRPAQSPSTLQAPSPATLQGQTPQQAQASFQQQNPQSAGATQPQGPNAQNMQRPGPFNIQQPGQNNAPQTQPQPGMSTNTGSTQSLSHQGALDASNAARQRLPQGSNPPSASGMGPTPGQASQGHNPQSFSGGSMQRTDSLNTNPKMPIPKQLNVSQPAPVTMGPQRPTLGGISSGPGVQGVMGQPVLQKPPGYTLEGEGEHVLSKKKLDELVRQVTGSEGPSTGLSSECEEAMLNIADEFIDDVITAACRLAKLRDSAVLDIRDIQIILERNYNIRIPGYALDEVRTVRKFHPAPGWTQKMNSIQAAKVMGGKNDV